MYSREPQAKILAAELVEEFNHIQQDSIRRGSEYLDAIPSDDDATRYLEEAD